MDKDGVIRAGNGSLEAAKEAGIQKVRIVKGNRDELIVVQRDDIEGEEATAYALVDNRTNELSHWDLSQLEVNLEGIEDIDLMGFAADDLKEIELSGLSGPRPEDPELDDVEPKLDKAEELRKKWQTEEGQLWIVKGNQEHRLLCGDSTKKEDVERLMGGAKAGLVFTSPPYGQQRDYDKDSKVDVSDWDALMNGVFSLLPERHDTQVLVNLGLIHRNCEWVPYWDRWVEWMRNQGWRRFGWYVWDQGFGLPGDWNGRFGPSHEFLFHFNKESVQPRKWVDKQPENIKPRLSTESTMRKRDGTVAAFTNPGASAQPTKVPDSVVRVGRSVGSHGHVAEFPVAFALAVILSFPAATYDPFLGSGSTTLAAEQAGVDSYGMEISPKYCAVILERMADAGCKCEKA